MKIILDAMGGDNAPEATIRGAVKAIKEINSEIILVGNEEKINKKEISIKDACLKLGISIDKYYRYKKSLD